MKTRIHSFFIHLRAESRVRLAKLLFAVAKRLCKTEFNELIGEVATGVASKVSTQMIRNTWIANGLAVCREPQCAQRFSLRKIGKVFACPKHFSKTDPARLAVV